MNRIQKLKTSMARFCKCGFELPIDEIWQAMELLILTWTDCFYKMELKLVSAYFTAINSVNVELVSFPYYSNFAEQISLFKCFRTSPS